MTPTIATLMKVAAALGTSVSSFIDEDVEVPAAIVVRGDERARLYTSKSGIALDNVSGRYGRYRLAGAEAVIEPLANSGPDPMRHPGEELIYLLEGAMCFTVDGEPIDLGARRLDPLSHRPAAHVGKTRPSARRARSGSW